MKYIKNVGFLFLLILCHNVFSGPGLFFNVSASGMPNPVDISLCLNGKGPLSCQHYHVSALTLSIRTTLPNRTYPVAGIKVNTPGYTLGNLGVDCKPLPNGYCLFTANDGVPKTFYVVTANGSLSISSSSGSSTLPNATANVPYSTAITVSDGVPPYTFSISSGQLPPGLTLNSTTGVLSGIPTGNGTYNFTITVTDSNQPIPHTGSQPFSLTVGGLMLSPPALPAGELSMAYNATITASGGIGPYTFAVTSGTVPPGLILNSNGTLSGTPTSVGNYSFTVTGTDTEGKTGLQMYLVVISGALTLSPPTLPAGQLSTVYNQAITANGGVGPYTFEVTSGILPPGLTLNANGTITGTPTSIGTYPLTITASDTMSSDTGFMSYSIVVSGALTLSPPALAVGELNMPYGQAITASGGVGPYTFAVTFGSLPPGLTLNADGTLSGIPTSIGTYPFTITATDTRSSDTGSQAYSLVISGSLTLSPPTLLAGELGTAYSQLITASGGVGPYTFTVTFGSLPPGLTLNADGTLSGTPTNIGTYPFTITATDTMSSDTGSVGYSIVVSGSLTLSPPTLPEARLSNAYGEVITANGGVGPYTFAVTSGIFPPGLILNADGTITGTPTTIGTYNFTITASDTMTPDTGSVGYSIVVSGSLMLNPSTLPPGQLSMAYNATITASGGVGPYSFSVTSGPFPPGLILNADGTITGTPTAIGTYNFTITASDTMSSATGSVGYSIVVSGSLILTPSTLPPGQIGSSYTDTIMASGGVGPYNFVVTSGPFPPGLTLNLNGNITGSPTSVGTYNFTITASDTMSSDTGSLGYSIAVSGTLTLSPATLPSGQLSTAYNATITASGSGSVGPYTYIVSSGTLPPGLTLNTNGTLTGIPTTSGSYSFTITATDTNSSTTTGARVYTLTVFPFAYVTNNGTNKVLSCTVNSVGALVLCTPLSNVFSGPDGIVLNAARTRAYVVNNTSSTVAVCPINSDGTFGACSSSNLGTAFNHPQGIALNTANTWAYVTNTGSSGISICSINPADGMLGTCTLSHSTIATTGIILNAANTWAYVANSASNTVSVCSINPADGTLGTCTPFNPNLTFNSPNGVILNAVNSVLYVANTGNNTISVCSINADGTLGTCAASNPDNTFSALYGIELNAANTVLYAANLGNNTVSTCSINVDGTLGTCAPFGGFNTPLGIALS